MSNEKRLGLDPGAAPRRKSITGCKCLLLTAAILFPISVILFLANIAHGVLQYGSDPHRALYQNSSLEDVKDRGSVVQPLISREETFDIAATVWLRSGEGIGHAAFIPDDKTNKNDTENDESPNELDVLETPLFSGTVFHGVRLTDKNVFATIKYKLPTAIFRDLDLSNYDLRGSFMLIPSSPSPLDRVTNYTTWIPNTIHPFPVRSWPFPLGSSNRSAKTLVDEAIETFGISIPLLEFHDIKSQCLRPEKTTGEETLSEEHTTIDGTAMSVAIDIEDDDESDDQDNKKEGVKDRVGEDTKSLYNKVSRKTILYGTKGRPVLENHPYVTTRTQIRVVDQTKLFNRKAYLKAHRQLRKTSCGQSVLGVQPSRYMCDPTYRVNGHWGTQLKIETLNENTNKPQIEWAYAPFMSTTKRPLGPKDILPVPVYREKCFEYLNGTQQGSFTGESQQESMDVIWKVSYSGRTPLKHGALEWSDLIFSKKMNMSESEYNQALKQDTAELYSGIAGHLFEEGMQPRRRAILNGIGTILSLVIMILDTRYWYTRTSTVSISILGGSLRASTYIIDSIGEAIKHGKENNLSVIGWISWCLYFGVISLTLPLLIIKVIARIEFGWWGTLWIPTVQIAHATHRERASERLEAKVSLRLKIALLSSIATIYYFLAPHDYHIITSLLPPPSPGDLKITRFEELAPFALKPMYFTGRILQLLLNRRSKTFAGSHRISVVLEAVVWLVSLAQLVPVLVGQFGARPAFLMEEIFEIAWVTVACWQAITLPSVTQVSDDEHIE
ncbi:hypothetical protein BDZ94DRAFT_1319290 [Collybia nuda]|uniref:Uncharacterized protein n=1 Tax=Collybia nuda TaxID=64659 RepID=A0A9P5YFP1_9AGAR|nr:hypothetical protein BDZ94DRAFT_1319290 [Collybia nuda]